MKCNKTILRTISVLLVILFAAGLCSCKPSSSSSEPSKSSEETVTENVTKESIPEKEEPEQEDFDRLTGICLEYNGEELYTAVSEDEDVSGHNAVLYPEGLSDNDDIVQTFILYDYLRIDKFKDANAAMKTIVFPDENYEFLTSSDMSAGNHVSYLTAFYPMQYIGQFRSGDCVVSIDITIGNAQSRDTFLLIMNDLKQMGLYVDEASFSIILTNYYPMESDGTYIDENITVTTEDMPLELPSSEFSEDTLYISYLPEDIDGVWLDEKGFFARFDIGDKKFYTADKSEYEIVSIESDIITVRQIYKAYEEDHTAEDLADGDGLISFPFRMCEDGSVDIMGHRIFRTDSKDGQVICNRVLKEAGKTTYSASDLNDTTVRIMAGEYSEGPIGNLTKEISGVEIRDCMLFNGEEILGYFRYSGDRTVWFIRLGEQSSCYGLLKLSGYVKIINKSVWMDQDGNCLTLQRDGFAFYLPDGELNGLFNIYIAFDNIISGSCADIFIDLTVRDPDTLMVSCLSCMGENMMWNSDSFTGLLLGYYKEDT